MPTPLHNGQRGTRKFSQNQEIKTKGRTADAQKRAAKFSKATGLYGRQKLERGNASLTIMADTPQGGC